MNIGKLYKTKKLCWMLYPSKDIATTAGLITTLPGLEEGCRAYWSKELNCNVSYVKQNSMFMLLVRDGEYIKILSANGEVGWIYFPDHSIMACVSRDGSCDIEEVI